MTEYEKKENDDEEVEGVDEKKNKQSEPIKADIPENEKKKNKFLIIGFTVFGICFLLLIIILTLLRSLGIVNN